MAGLGAPPMGRGRAARLHPLRDAVRARRPWTRGPARPSSRQVVVVLVDGLGLAGVARACRSSNELRARGADYDCRIGEPSLSLPGRAVMLSGAWQEVNGQPTNYDPAAAARRARLHGGAPAGRCSPRWPRAPGGAPAVRARALAPGRLCRRSRDRALRDLRGGPAPAGRRRAARSWSELRGQPALVMVELHAVDESGPRLGRRFRRVPARGRGRPTTPYAASRRALDLEPGHAGGHRGPRPRGHRRPRRARGGGHPRPARAGRGGHPGRRARHGAGRWTSRPR